MEREIENKWRGEQGKKRITLLGIIIIISIIAALVIADVLSTHIYEIKKRPYMYINKTVIIDACTDPHGEQRGGWRPNYAGFWIQDLKMDHEYIPNVECIFVKYAGEAPSPNLKGVKVKGTVRGLYIDGESWEYTNKKWSPAKTYLL